MAAHAIREYDGKRLLSRWLNEFSDGSQDVENRVVQITPDILDASKPHVSFDSLAEENPWLLSSRLVVKPDQLIKRRGKAGLLAINKTWAEVQAWVMERMNKEQRVEVVKGILNTFIVEPFVPHEASDEYYLCIQSHREKDEFLFCHEGGVDVGDVDAKAVRLDVGITAYPTEQQVAAALLQQVPVHRHQIIASFLIAALKVFRELNFVYMEINPLVVVGNRLTPLDMAAKIDETGHYVSGHYWGNLEFPAPFGRAEFPEEEYIRSLDAKTGASLKLTILNHTGRVWTMVAGGGASVVYADTISDLGFGGELANYGEYSGAPTEAHTYEYAKTILSLMTRNPDARGKVLIIGGGIANFTDVAKTFKGIVRALKDYQDELRKCDVKIWVRRAGPNYLEGLRLMRDTGAEIKVPMHVYGPETDIAAIVPMALGLRAEPPKPEDGSDLFENPPAPRVTRTSSVSPGMGVGAGKAAAGAAASTALGNMPSPSPEDASEARQRAEAAAARVAEESGYPFFSRDTQSIVYGMQNRAVQGMLDFDVMCKREKPSVSAMVFPFGGNHYAKFYWNTNEILVPVYTSVEEACAKHPNAKVCVNFASSRSVFSSAMEVLKMSSQIRTMAIIAEGVPESQTRQINAEAIARKVHLIGPATVGGIKPGCFRIGNTGGMLDNILYSKLYRPGSVAYVSKSGGMSNELNNVIAHRTDGVYEGVAIGGDRYPGSRFIDHLLRYNDNPEVKMMVLLGEVGGTDEFEVVRAVKSGRITKPLVAWCIGTCATLFPFEVQFGHAGALARGESETAAAKNSAMKDVGIHVPRSFDELGDLVGQVYEGLVATGLVVPRPEPAVPKIPMDFNWAKSLGLVRKPAAFISSICDDRGDELLYAGMPISKVFSEDIGIGGVLSLLWFRRRLPAYATKFIEMVLMVTADHGPAVSGAHNTIVTARAGKDLISALTSGLLTIGPRFGGALDEAASTFTKACDAGKSAQLFVKEMRDQNRLIMGIGHRIKSLQNPDMRCVIIKEYARKHFPSTRVLDFALDVEKVTTKKRNTLILNVDGCIAVCFVDLLRSCGAFNHEEVDEHIANGCLNGLFVLGRSIGFVGHYLDQKRLKQGLYRHPWDDISYINQGED